MIKYVQHSEIDFEAWDHCIENASNRTIFCYSWYLNAVADQWDALVLDQYDAIMPLPYKKKMGVRVLYQPFFSRQLGVFAKQAIDKDLSKDFIEHIPDDFKLVKIGFGIEELQNISGFDISHYPYQVLDVSVGYKAIAAGYSQNAKRLIKKGTEAGLVVKPLQESDRIVSMFRQTKGDKLGQFNDTDYNHLHKLMLACSQQKRSISLGVYNREGEMLGSGFFMLESNRITYLKGAVLDSGKKIGAMYCLFNELFQHHCTDKQIFDFGGSRNPGVASFYKKFGATDQEYLFVEKDDLPATHKAMRRIKHMFS